MLAPTFCEHRIQDDPNRPFPTSSFALTIHILLTFPGKTTFVNTLCEAEVIGQEPGCLPFRRSKIDLKTPVCRVGLVLGRDFNSRGMETCRGSIPPPWRQPQTT